MLIRVIATLRNFARLTALPSLLWLSSAAAQQSQPDVRALFAGMPIEGYQYGFWTPLAAAPSVLHWKFGIDLGDLPTTMQEALGDAQASPAAQYPLALLAQHASVIPVSNYVGSSTQRVSLQVAKPFGPSLFAGERRTIRELLRLNPFNNTSIVAYHVASLPTSEAAARELLDFAQTMGMRTIITDSPPEENSAIDMLSRAYEVNIAVCTSYRIAINVVVHAGSNIGVCLNTARLAQEGIKPEQAVAELGHRIQIVEIQPSAERGANSIEVVNLLGALYSHGIKPELFVVRARPVSDRSAMLSLQRSLVELDAVLRPLIADRTRLLSRLPDQGRGEATAEQREQNVGTPGNGVVWDPATPDRQAAIEAAIPMQPIVKPKKPRKLLVIDLNIGYPGHQSIPTHNFGLQELGSKTGAYQAVFDNNLDNLRYPKIKQYDAIFLNNTVGLIFEDPAVREGLLRFVREGGGLGGNHASIYANMDWPEFSEMIGAFPTFHQEPTEKAWIQIDDPKSPINAGFEGHEFLYQDEFIRFVDPYSREKLHVLLRIDVAKTDMAQLPMDAPAFGQYDLGRQDSDYAVSWIRDYGRGRVFYAAFGHNATLFATPGLARFMLAGLQFILGDLPADAMPSGRIQKPVEITNYGDLPLLRQKQGEVPLAQHQGGVQ